MPIVIVLAIAVYLLRDIAISLVFTEAFRPARNLFAVQLMGDIIKILAWLYAYPMLSHGATKMFITTEVLFSLSFILLAFLLVKKYGVHGANYAYGLSYVFYFIYIYKNVNKFIWPKF